MKEILKHQKAMDGEDKEAIKTAVEKLINASMKLGENLSGTATGRSKC